VKTLDTQPVQITEALLPGFDEILTPRALQFLALLERIEPELFTAQDLLTVPEGNITEDGLRTNLRVGVQYLTAWLAGVGCVSLNHLMEDAAADEDPGARYEMAANLLDQLITQANFTNPSRFPLTNFLETR
jgi:hypothetical protein